MVNAESSANVSASCCRQEPKFDGMSPVYKRVLWAVIAINAVMFGVEMTAGAIAGSQALQADALDFLGDTLTYGRSQPLRHRQIDTRSHGRGPVQGPDPGPDAQGLWVFGDTLYAVLVLGVPRAEIMGLVGFLALTANLACVLPKGFCAFATARPMSAPCGCAAATTPSAMSPSFWRRAASGRPAPPGPTWWLLRRWRVCSFGPQRTLPFRHCGNTASATISSRKEANDSGFHHQIRHMYVKLGTELVRRPNAVCQPLR